MLAVSYTNIDKLVPYIGNARSHPKKQIAQIVASIGEFGFCNPILVDKELNVVAGHGRLIAARQIGLEQVPIIVLSELSEAQVRALRLADNKIALNSAWDEDMLAAELSALGELDMNIELTGFSAGEINLTLKDAFDPEDNVIPSPSDMPKTGVGDVWELGPHRIGCGDIRDGNILHQVFAAGELADAAFLDPPYDVRIKGHANVKASHREFAMASGEMGSERFTNFLRECLGTCAQISKDGAVHFVCMDWRHQLELAHAAKPVYGSQLNLCVWDKSNAGMGALYRSKHELVSVYKVGTAPHLNTVELGKHGRNRVNVWSYASVNTFNAARRADLELHPTVKPIALVADAIKDVTRRGDLVLDAFLGSGTTLLACERTGRRCRAIEIDPAYVDIALDRWTAMTGGTPKLISQAEGEPTGAGWPS